MSIVVTATSGHLGRLIVRDLLARGVPAADVVAGARSLDAIADLAAAGVRTALIDYADPATVEAPATAGDTSCSSPVTSWPSATRSRPTPSTPRSAPASRTSSTPAARAAKSPSPIAANHAATEKVVRDSGVPFTVLRNGWYTENYARTLPAVRDSGVLLASVGDGRSPPPPAWISPRPAARS